MTSPVETIADALIAFILSLLKDPNAVEEFAAQPSAMLANNGLQGVCMADVAAVRPVIVDNSRVIHHDTPPPPPPRPDGPDGPDPDDNETVREIVRMVQQFTTNIDARSTIVDQSVNQNIWTEGGDVTQLFDQEAIVASGDGSIAAGDDVSVVDSDVDVSMGDVSIGNETNDGSFNQTGDGSFNDGEADPETDAASAGVADTEDADTEDATADGATPENVATATAAAEGAVDTATAAAAAAAPTTPPPPPADVPEPADLLEGDMASGNGDTYEADAASAALDDTSVDAPLEDD